MMRIIWAIAILILTNSGWAECPDVEITRTLPLSFGTLTTLPEASGFLELHPDHGLSISSTSAVHSGDFGLGEFAIIGPIRAQLELVLEVIQTADQPHPHLVLAELITQAQAGVVRLDRHGGRIMVSMPDDGNDVGRARLLLPIGAVMRFSNSAERQEAEYRVVAECVSMALP